MNIVTTPRFNLYEKIIYWLICLTLLLGFIFQFINHLTYQFPGNTYAPPFWYLAMLVIIFALSLGHYIKPNSPLLFLWLFATLVTTLVYISSQVLLESVQYTPFYLIDQNLLRFDQWLGFSTPALLNFTFAHPYFKKILLYSYDFAVFELFFIPYLLLLFNRIKPMYHFYILMLLSFILSLLIYYFFPTIGPFLEIKNPDFPHVFYKEIVEYFQLHADIKPLYKFVGIISFPSLHVLWILITLYVLKSIKWLFYPFLIINFFAFTATLLLGYHYLADDLTSLVIFFGVMWPFIRGIDTLSKNSD